MQSRITNCESWILPESRLGQRKKELLVGTSKASFNRAKSNKNAGFAHLHHCDRMRASLQAAGALKGAMRSFTLPLPRPSIVLTVVPQAVSSWSKVSSSPHERLFSTTPCASAAPLLSSGKSTASSEASVAKGPIRDEAIIPLSSYVRLVDPKTGSLAGPFNTRQILAKLDRTKFFLQQVAPAQSSRATIDYDPSSPPSTVDASQLVQFAICKLIDKKEEFDRLRNLKRKSHNGSFNQTAANSTSSSKEVQLTWSVSPNDLAHKLGKAKKEMLKGARINVVISTKPGGRKYIKGLNPELDEQRGRLLEHIEEFLCTDTQDAQQTAEQAEEKGSARIARRLGEIDWQRGGSAAVMSFECFRNK